MADKKGGAALYGKPPKIEADKGDGDTNRSGHMSKASAKASSTAGDAKPSGDMTSGSDAKGDVMAGTDGIPTHHHAQHAERSEMHHRHQLEHVMMHGRHQEDHLKASMGHHGEAMPAMHQRHHQERRTLHTTHEREVRDTHSRHEAMGDSPTGGIKQESVGKSGTEPS